MIFQIASSEFKSQIKNVDTSHLKNRLNEDFENISGVDYKRLLMKLENALNFIIVNKWTKYSSIDMKKINKLKQIISYNLAFENSFLRHSNSRFNNDLPVALGCRFWPYFPLFSANENTYKSVPFPFKIF